MKSKTTIILWIVYLCLLGVLLPHTAWAFSNWEPTGTKLTHWVAAVAFEAAIAALTHKLAKHIEETPKGKKGFSRFSYRYLNPFSFGLGIVTVVSALANLAHAVEFGRELKIFTEWGISLKTYSLAFGGVLPLVSLIFARVLSNVVDSEDAPNPDLEQAKLTIVSLRKQVHDTEAKARDAEGRVKEVQEQAKALVNDAEDRARLAEERFGAIGDLVRRLFDDDKRNRIIAARQWKPQLSGQAIAVITDSSPAYVSEVLKEMGSVDV